MSDKTLEKNLWRWVKTGCRGEFQEQSLYMERVENSVASGTPDVDGCLNGACFKIELKTAARPRNPGNCVAVKFTPAQIPWHKRYARSAGPSFILIQVGSGSAARRYLIHGDKAANVQLGVPESTLNRLSVTPSDATAAEIIVTASTC